MSVPTREGRSEGPDDPRPPILPRVVLLALVVGTAWLWTHPPGPESGETSHWWPLVVNLARGKGYAACFPEYFPFCAPDNQVSAAREPVPVLLFAAVARLTRESLLAAALAEMALNTGVVVGLFLLGRHLAGPGAGALAALLWSAYLPALEMTLQVSGEIAAALGVVWGLLFFARAGRSDRARDLLAAGCCVALGGLSRSPVLVLAPALVLAEYLRSGVAIRQSWRRIALFGTAFLLTIAPWVARNALVFGRPLAGTTLGGYNLYRHNSLLPSGDYLRPVAGAESAQAVGDLLARRSDLRGTEDEAEMDAVYRREALGIIERWPLRYAWLSLYRFLPLWFNYGIREAYGVRRRLPDDLLALEQALLLGAMLVGLARAGRVAWPLGLSVAAYTLAHMLVNGQLRYLVPVMPLVMALGAVAPRCLRPRPGAAPPG